MDHDTPWINSSIYRAVDRAAAQDKALKLAARWQSFGDGEDAQSECAAELRAALADVPHP